MLFFYIRHGDPIYEPDSLTSLGERQAEALAKRLAVHGIDRIFSSSSNRAIQTAKPLSEILKKEIEIEDFANECYAGAEFNVKRNGSSKWMFFDAETKRRFADEDIITLGHRWCEHEEFTAHKKGVERIAKESFRFFKALGYEHIENSGVYKVLQPNDERIAFFAHQGFGIAFLSEILGIPYPIFANHFDVCHSGMTVIEFREEDGFAIPKVLMLSSDSHMYREGLPLKYSNRIYI